MTVNLEQIVFDARDAAALAAFWSALLEQPVDPGAGAEFASVGRTGPLPASDSEGNVFDIVYRVR